jgi:DeoR family transcriptional regulator, fructose operon transcriptional repressor
MSEFDTTLEYAEERKRRIVEILQQREKVSVEELCDLFKVTGATIRTYLRQLQQAGLLTRTHGGAILKSSLVFEPDSSEKAVQHLEAKRRIAQAALALIKNGESILLDTGTTTLELAKLLHSRSDLIVTTNDIDIARTLENIESITVIMLGGLLRKRFHCTVGGTPIEMLANMNVDKAFMAANSFALESGAMTPDSEQAALKRQMIRAAKRTIFLCDHSKLGRQSLAKFADLNDIDVLIMNDVEAATKKELTTAGIEIIDC